MFIMYCLCHRDLWLCTSDRHRYRQRKRFAVYSTWRY